MDKLLSQFTPAFQAALLPHNESLNIAREIRIRLGQPLLVRADREIWIESIRPDAQDLRDLLLAFCGNALYAHEEQLRSGYLTLVGGHRVGVCGRMVEGTDGRMRLAQVQGMSIRIARQLPCEDRAVRAVWENGVLRSALVVSPPGLGKTTLLREMARRLSEAGVQVGLIDERGELAACREGLPQLDVGRNTDVMDNMDKTNAMRLMLRSMSPELLVCDEIGAQEEAQMLLDARKSGVKVLCSAHGMDMQDVRGRPVLRVLAQEGVFDRVILLGSRAGRIRAICDGEGRPC